MTIHISRKSGMCCDSDENAAMTLNECVYVAHDCVSIACNQTGKICELGGADYFYFGGCLVQGILYGWPGFVILLFACSTEGVAD